MRRSPLAFLTAALYPAGHCSALTLRQLTFADSNFANPAVDAGAMPFAGDLHGCQCTQSYILLAGGRLPWQCVLCPAPGETLTLDCSRQRRAQVPGGQPEGEGIRDRASAGRPPRWRRAAAAAPTPRWPSMAARRTAALAARSGTVTNPAPDPDPELSLKRTRCSSRDVLVSPLCRHMSYLIR